MIGIGERHEALRVPRGRENAAGVVDAHDLVRRRMEYQQRLAQDRNAPAQRLLGNIVQELAADAERPAGERNLHLAACADLFDLVLEDSGDMRGIGRRRDGDHRTRLRHCGGGRQDGGAAQAVADEDRGCPPFSAQLIGRGDQIGNIGGEGRVGELPFARSETGEIEAEDRNPERSQSLGDSPGGVHVLAAGEAMGKERVGACLALRLVEEARQAQPLGIEEIETLRRHSPSSPFRGRSALARIIFSRFPLLRPLCLVSPACGRERRRAQQSPIYNLLAKAASVLPDRSGATASWRGDPLPPSTVFEPISTIKRRRGRTGAHRAFQSPSATRATWPAKAGRDRMRHMTKSRNRSFNRAALAVIAISFASALGATRPAVAAPNYDGLWSVVIMTEKGTCDRAYRYPVRIANGQVQNDGPSLINVSGRVGGNGAVKVLVSAGDQSATGTGRLSGKVGAGQWSGGECAGHWQAERRD